MVGDAAEAEDLTQEALLRVLHGLPRFRGESSLKTWALRIARNVVVDSRRRAATRPHANAGDAAEPDRLRDTRQLLPDEELQRALSEGCLLDALRTLPEAYCEVFALHDLAGLENAAIAARLGLPVSTVKMRLHRARRRLRRACEALCEITRGGGGQVDCCPKTPHLR